MPSLRITSKNTWHIVFALDDSSGMAGEQAQDLNDAVEELVDSLFYTGGHDLPFRLSVVSYGSSASVLCESQKVDENFLGKLAPFSGANGTRNVSSALDMAWQVLVRNPGRPSDFEPFVILLCCGEPDSVDRAMISANRIRNLFLDSGKPRLVTLCVGDSEYQLMQELATNDRLACRMGSSKDFIRILPAIGVVGSMVHGGASEVEEALGRLWR